MAELSEAYVIGLLVDLDAAAPRRIAELQRAEERAGAVDAELSQLLRRLDESRQAEDAARGRMEKASLEVNESNQRVASLHQEVAALRRRSEDFRVEMERAEPGAIQRRLRRERAKLTVQIEDREAEIAALRQSVDIAREQQHAAEGELAGLRDRRQSLTRELDGLQGQLPNPYLYAEIFQTLSAQAHCNLFLDGDADAWRHAQKNAVGYITTLHRDLRAGKYRLDKNSELLAGRSVSGGEAVYAMAALGDDEGALELFALITDPSLFFHDIFNVFRIWCLGLYLGNRHNELRALLRRHQFSEGLRGGYTQAFIGLLLDEPHRVVSGLKDIVKHEWQLRQDPHSVRGSGVVNLGAAVICMLALRRRMKISLPGPTVPRALFERLK